MKAIVDLLAGAAYWWKLRPSMRTTRYVFRRRLTCCSNNLTYSYLQRLNQSGRESMGNAYFELAICVIVLQSEVAIGVYTVGSYTTACEI